MNSDYPFRGLVGMYALALMEREGPVHGYLVAERISERTEGQWHPGAGAIYPALRRLAARRLVRAVHRGRRTLYVATPNGRAVLRDIRRARAVRRQTDRDLTPLWAEVVGERDVDAFVLARFHRSSERLVSLLASLPTGSFRKRNLREAAIKELDGWLGRIRDLGELAPARTRRAAASRSLP